MKFDHDAQYCIIIIITIIIIIIKNNWKQERKHTSIRTDYDQEASMNAFRRSHRLSAEP
jgi:hypothetical protein